MRGEPSGEIMRAAISGEDSSLLAALTIPPRHSPFPSRFSLRPTHPRPSPLTPPPLKSPPSPSGESRLPRQPRLYPRRSHHDRPRHTHHRRIRRRESFAVRVVELSHEREPVRFHAKPGRDDELHLAHEHREIEMRLAVQDDRLAQIELRGCPSRTAPCCAARESTVPSSSRSAMNATCRFSSGSRLRAGCDTP